MFMMDTLCHYYFPNFDVNDVFGVFTKYISSDGSSAVRRYSLSNRINENPHSNVQSYNNTRTKRLQVRTLRILHIYLHPNVQILPKFHPATWTFSRFISHPNKLTIELFVSRVYDTSCSVMFKTAQNSKTWHHYRTVLGEQNNVATTNRLSDPYARAHTLQSRNQSN